MDSLEEQGYKTDEDYKDGAFGIPDEELEDEPDTI